MAEIGERVQQILERSGALLGDDHFVYVSGEHGTGWIDKDAVYPHTEYTRELGELIAEVSGDEVDVVCGPATGGLILAQWTAHAIGALAVFGEHGEPSKEHLQGAASRRPFVLKRGYERIVPGRRVLVVDDVVNTGFSIRGTIHAVRECGGIVEVAATVANRGSCDAKDLGAERLVSLLDVQLDSWPRDSCPLCQRGVPINQDYAHGRDYVDAGGDWPP